MTSLSRAGSRVVVVGASLAGLNAARTLRREGYDGTLTIVGAEAQRPYDRPPLSKQVLSEDWDISSIDLVEDVDDGLELDWMLGATAQGLDIAGRRLTLGDGSLIDFDGLVIATGATPRRMPGTDHLAGVHVLRTYDDAVALRRDLDAGPHRVVIVGSGFVGAEVAAACRKRGVEVTILEALAEPFARVLGVEVGSACSALHRGHGVDVRGGVAVVGFEGSDRVTGVELASGERIVADVVVVGVGVIPATGWLAESGLDVTNGVLVDESCLAAPGIVAAGDVARWPNRRFGGVNRVEHWDNAIRQGEHAARTLLGEREPYYPVPWFWSDQYDRKLQFAGDPVGCEEVAVIEPFDDDQRMVALYRRGDRLVAVAAINRPRRLLEFRRLITEGGTWEHALDTARMAV